MKKYILLIIFYSFNFFSIENQAISKKNNSLSNNQSFIKIRKRKKLPIIKKRIKRNKRNINKQKIKNIFKEFKQEIIKTKNPELIHTFQDLQENIKNKKDIAPTVEKIKEIAESNNFTNITEQINLNEDIFTLLIEILNQEKLSQKINFPKKKLSLNSKNISMQIAPQEKLQSKNLIKENAIEKNNTNFVIDKNKNQSVLLENQKEVSKIKNNIIKLIDHESTLSATLTNTISELFNNIDNNKPIPKTIIIQIHPDWNTNKSNREFFSSLTKLSNEYNNILKEKPATILTLENESNEINQNNIDEKKSIESILIPNKNISFNKKKESDSYDNKTNINSAKEKKEDEVGSGQYEEKINKTKLLENQNTVKNEADNNAVQKMIELQGIAQAEIEKEAKKKLEEKEFQEDQKRIEQELINSIERNRKKSTNIINTENNNTPIKNNINQKIPESFKSEKSPKLAKNHQKSEKKPKSDHQKIINNIAKKNLETKKNSIKTNEEISKERESKQELNRQKETLEKIERAKRAEARAQEKINQLELEDKRLTIKINQLDLENKKLTDIKNKSIENTRQIDQFKELKSIQDNISINKSKIEENKKLIENQKLELLQLNNNNTLDKKEIRKNRKNHKNKMNELEKKSSEAETNVQAREKVLGQTKNNLQKNYTHKTKEIKKINFDKIIPENYNSSLKEALENIKKTTQNNLEKIDTQSTEKTQELEREFNEIEKIKKNIIDKEKSDQEADKKRKSKIKKEKIAAAELKNKHLAEAHIKSELELRNLELQLTQEKTISEIEEQNKTEETININKKKEKEQVALELERSNKEKIINEQIEFDNKKKLKQEQRKIPENQSKSLIYENQVNKQNIENIINQRNFKQQILNEYNVNNITEKQPDIAGTQLNEYKSLQSIEEKPKPVTIDFEGLEPTSKNSLESSSPNDYKNVNTLQRFSQKDIADFQSYLKFNNPTSNNNSPYPSNNSFAISNASSLPEMIITKLMQQVPNVLKSIKK